MIQIPTITQLQAAIVADLEANLEAEIPEFGKTFLNALAATQAAKLNINYLTLARIEKNIFPDTADRESLGGSLERFGRVKLGRNPFPATPGVYAVQVTGTTGAVIPASTTFKSNDDSLSPGKLFVLDDEFILDGTNVISLRALESGVGSKLEITNQLTVTAPIALVDSIVEVINEVTEPRAEEDIEEYRRKIIEAYRLEAQGGAGADYRLWSNEVQGVRQSYPYASDGGLNEVDLYIEATVEDSIDGMGTPSAALLQDVEDNIELPIDDQPARKPITVDVNYLPVVPREIEIVINDFDNATTEKEQLIFDGTKLFLESVRPFVSSIDVLSEKNDIFSTNTVISLILQALPGSVFGSVDLIVDGYSENSITFEYGDIPFLVSVTLS